MVTGLGVGGRLRLGSLDLAVGLTAARGETVGIVGPNGAGKTTLLRLLAGLLRLDEGTVVLDGAVLDGGPDGPWVPPEDRPVGLVFQDHLLFPHLSALDNVAFGLRAGGLARRPAAERAREALERVGLAASADLRPAALSGGQAQRVALARTLVLGPALLLLDEPMAALDPSTRSATRHDLAEVLRDHAGPCVVVTHDIVDAAALADRIVVLEGGHVTQAGSLAELAAGPRSPFVADLVGVNLFRGRAAAGDVALDGTDLVLVTGGAAEGDVLVTIHPRAVTLHPREPSPSSSRNCWPGLVRNIERRHGATRVQLTLEGAVALVAEITDEAVTVLDVAIGSPLWASVKAVEVVVSTW